MSNLTNRVLAAIVGIPLLLAVVISGGKILLIFTLLLSSLALWEFYGMFIKKGYSPLRIPMLILSAISIILFDLYRSEYLITVLYLSFVLSSIIQIFKGKNWDPMNIMIDVFGLIYISIPLSLLSGLASHPKGNIVLYVFILIWSCDTFAYFGGRMFGKTPLSSISPKKTIEGSVTGLVLTALISVALHFLFPERLTLFDAVYLGVIIGMLSQAGDLFESMIKRYCDVKDSSNIIPGHGGVLDRFDSLLFVIPFVYIYFFHFQK